MRCEQQLRLELVPPVVQAWRRWRYPGGLEIEAMTPRWWGSWFAIVVPRWLRWTHRWYAARRGLFWMPCVLCRREYGGHETCRYLRGRSSSIPDPTNPRLWMTICPWCTLAGRGSR